MPWTCSRCGVGVLGLEDLALDPVEIDLHAVGDAAMRQSLDQRFVGVLEARVLADDGDRDLSLGIVDRLDELFPAREVRGRRAFDAEGVQDLAVEPLAVVDQRHLVDVAGVARLDHGGRPNVAEERELAPLVLGDRAVGAAEQDVRLDADGAKLLHTVLRRLGLQFAGARDVGQQRQVDVAAAAARQVVSSAAGSPRRTAGPRCRRPCRQPRRARNHRRRCRRARNP